MRKLFKIGTAKLSAAEQRQYETTLLSAFGCGVVVTVLLIEASDTDTMKSILAWIGFFLIVLSIFAYYKRNNS
jgi:hypothetical protein